MVIAIVGGLIYALATSASGFAGVGSVSPNPTLSGEPTRRRGHPTQRAFSLPEVGAALHVLVKSGMRGGRGLRRGSIQLASLARRGAAAASRALGALGRLRPRAAAGETVELEAAFEAEEIDRLEDFTRGVIGLILLVGLVSAAIAASLAAAAWAVVHLLMHHAHLLVHRVA